MSDSERSDIRTGDISHAKGVAIGPGATAVVYEGLTVQEVATLVDELKNRELPVVWDGRIPYVGLRAFQEKDAEFFFGRDALVDDLLGRVEQGLRFITIAGPSGSGKSSVARAGLFHALRSGRLDGSENWVLATMSPKADPIANLGLAFGRDLSDRQAEAVLLEEASDNPLSLHEQVERLTAMSDDPHRRFVLLVDQFEELFTQTGDADQRQAFIRLLTAAAETAGSRVIVVVSLRSDFVSNCALYPALREQINKENQFVLVGAMEPRDLAVAITRPSLEVGTEIDPALVKQIVDDMKGEPGSLPLMSFALRDLFLAERPKEGPGHEMDMTLGEYLDRGGLSEALERHANKVFETFSDEQRTLARSIFVKLITVGEGRLDTRRTASFAELVPAGTSEALVATTVAELAHEKTRLITTQGIDEVDDLAALDANEATVTIAHEKLIEAWPWLRQLVDENREIIKLQNQVRSDAQAWSVAEDPGFLYRGGRLAQVEDRLGELGPSLDALSKRFITASQEEREAELTAEAERIREQEALVQERANAGRLGRQRRWLAVAVGVAIVAFLVAGVLGLLQRQTAQEVRTLKNSIQASQLAQATGLATDPGLQLLLATTALGLSTQGDTRAAFDVAAYRLTILYGHTAGVRSAAFSPDGSQIVTASDDGTARLWDTAGNELAVLEGHIGPVLSAAFSPDGSKLVTSGGIDQWSGQYDNAARLWDAAGNARAVLEGHTGPVRSAAFSPDGSQIVTASLDGTARLWDAAGNALAVLEGHTGEVYSAAFSPDGSQIVTASADGTARLWDAAGNALAVLEGHTDWVRYAAFSPDGSQIVTASSDNTARLWDAAGNELAVLEGHTDTVLSAAFSPDGSQIVTSSGDNTARLWDAAGNALAILGGHTSLVYSAAFSPDGSQIVTASRDGTARLWDAAGNALAILGGHTDAVRSAAFSPDGSQIVTASDDGTARLWDAAGNAPAVLEGHTEPVRSAAFSPDGSQIVTASDDSTARLWDAAGNELAVLEGHTGGVYSAAFSPDGSQIVTASDDTTARLWDAAGNELAVLEGHTNWVNSAAFSPDGSQIVTASDDDTARLWDAAGNELAVLEGHTDWVWSAAFSPDGSQIVTASDDGTARLWDAAGNELAVLEGHTDGVNSAAFSPDGSQIVTASWDNTARLWDTEGNELAVLKGHTYDVRSAAFSPDGSQIVTASHDHTARLWDAAGNELAVLEGHTELVISAVFRPGGSQIVTASGDGTARLWDAAGNELAVLEGHTGYVLSAAFSPDGQRILTAGEDGTTRLWLWGGTDEERIAAARQRLGNRVFIFTDAECARFFTNEPESCPRTPEELWGLFEDDSE